MTGFFVLCGLTTLAVIVGIVYYLKKRGVGAAAVTAAKAAVAQDVAAVEQKIVPPAK